MNDNQPREASGNDDSRWPAASILAYGTFGTKDPAGRRYHIRCFVALAALGICIVLSDLLRSSVPKGVLRAAAGLAPGVAFSYIAWEFRRYLGALDELARRIQIESMAWTYLCALPIAALLGGLGLVSDWRLNPMWFIVLELVRAGWLYVVSRRYQ